MVFGRAERNSSWVLEVRRRRWLRSESDLRVYIAWEKNFKVP